MHSPFTHARHGTSCVGFQHLSILRVAILNTLNAAVSYVFLATYRFNSGEQGLAYISFGIGFTLGLATVICVAQHKVRKARAASAKGIRVKAPAETRLQLTRIGGLVLPLGIFWWGWSLQTHVSLDWPNGRNGRYRLGAVSDLCKDDVLLEGLIANKNLDNTVSLCG